MGMLKKTVKTNKEVVSSLSDELGIPDEKIPILVEKMLQNNKARDKLFRALGEFFGRRSFLEALVAGGVIATGLASARTVITDRNIQITDPDTGLEWYLRTPLPFSAIVGIEDGKVKAYDWKGNLIAKGEAGVDDAEVIKKASDSLTAGRTWKEKVVLKGNFSLNDEIQVPSYTTLVVDGKLESTVDKPVLTIIDREHVDIICGVVKSSGLGDNSYGIFVGASSDVLIFKPEVTNFRKPGICVVGVDLAGNFIRNSERITLFEPYIHDGIQVAGADGIYMIAQNSDIVRPRIENITQESGIAISGNPQKDSSYISKHIKIDHPYLYNTGAIYLANNGYDIDIIKPTIINSISYGIRTGYTSLGTAGMTDVRVYGGLIENPAEDGVKLEYGSNWKFFGTKVKGAGGAGFNVLQDYNEFYGVTAEGCSLHGLWLNYGSHNRVFGGLYKDNGGWGIKEVNADYNIIERPICINNTEGCVDLVGTNSVLE